MTEQGLDGPEKRLYVGIDLDTSDSLMHRLLVDANGYIMDMDDTTLNLSQIDNFELAFSEAVIATQDRLDSKRRAAAHELAVKKSRKELARKKALQVIAGVVTGAVVVGGAGLGVYKWGVEPARKAQAERVAYDNEGNILPGETFELDGMEVSQLPKEDFDIIPEFEEKRDSLESPRTVEMAPNTCKVIEFKPQPGQELGVAIREGSNLDDAVVSASKDSDGNIRLCIADPDNESAVYEPVAIQVTSPN